MKRKWIFLVGLSLVILAGACEYGDLEIRTTVSAEQVMENFKNTQDHALGVYSQLPSGFEYIDGAMMASATDEAEHTEETSLIQYFNEGSWSQYNNPDDAWEQLFKGVRKANLFLSMSDSVNLDAYLQTQTEGDLELYRSMRAQIIRWKYEVRFLRAYYYFELVKRYGGVPILTEALALDAESSAIKRNSLEECFDFIADECDSAAVNLPLIYDFAEDLGRATKGAAMALKSRALLYAASDLFNDPSWAGGYAAPELIALQGDRNQRWQAAADAALDLISLSDTMGYRLTPDYGELFQGFTGTEVIFTRRLGSTNSFEKASYPVGFDLGKSGTTPSQNLVDAYEMNNGMAITEPGSGYDPMHPYENRDPRLNMTILTNNSEFNGRPVECWTGGKDGPGIPLATKTGYYLKKYVIENLDLLLDNKGVHSWHLFRLGEIYLNYAEALNEVQPGHPDIKYYVDLVRARDSVAMPPVPAGLDQGQMRERIRNERRIELAFEDHRNWDLRRWLLAGEVLNEPLRGMGIEFNATDSTFTYREKIVEQRLFVPRMYLYPIPEAELTHAGWPQNPMW